jgi:Fe-S-cluster containining protein
VTAGTSLFGFRCTRCGNCCRDARVPLTDVDLMRLSAHTGSAPADLVEWLSADEIDMTGEPETQVRDRSGYRTLVLRHARGSCDFFDESAGCTAYDARPVACRTYPLDASFGRRGGVRRLRLLPGASDACDFARDGRVDLRELRADTERQDRELASYAERVSRWNRMQARRARFGHALRTTHDFIVWAFRELSRNTSDTSPSDDSRQRLDPACTTDRPGLGSFPA